MNQADDKEILFDHFTICSIIKKIINALFHTIVKHTLRKLMVASKIILKMKTRKKYRVSTFTDRHPISLMQCIPLIHIVAPFL